MVLLPLLSISRSRLKDKNSKMTRAVDDMDSDSYRTPLDDDKKIGTTASQFETIGRSQFPPDPDAGLSEEEKAHIVCVGHHVHDDATISVPFHPCHADQMYQRIGQSAPMEA